jgi:hypothetical protein
MNLRIRFKIDCLPIASVIHVETQKLSLTPKGCGAHGCGMWIVICHNIVSIIIDKCCKNTNYYYQSITFQEKNVIKSI